MATPSHFRAINEPPEDTNQPRILNSIDVEQGVILWLPTYPEMATSWQQRGYQQKAPVVTWRHGTPAGAKLYKHPILVISRPEKCPDNIHFLVLTSFHGQAIRKHFEKHLALSPAPDHPLFLRGHSAYRTLTFKDGLSTDRAGYVKVSEVYRMQWQNAQPYWTGYLGSHRKIKLDQESLELVLSATKRLTGCEPGIQSTYLQSISPGQVVATAGTPLPSLYLASESTNRSNRMDDRAIRSATLPCTNERSSKTSGTRVDHSWSREEEPLLPTHQGLPSRGDGPVGRGFWFWLCGLLKRVFVNIARFLF